MCEQFSGPLFIFCSIALNVIIFADIFVAYFLGAHPRLKSAEVVAQTADRLHAATCSGGVIRLQLEVVKLALT
jgi:hypothetical protein